MEKDPRIVSFSNFPKLSESIVNTERVTTVDRAIYHYEGGWPSEIDITDKNEMKKMVKKKLEKNQDNVDKFTPAIKKLVE